MYSNSNPKYKQNNSNIKSSYNNLSGNNPNYNSATSQSYNSQTNKDTNTPNESINTPIDSSSNYPTSYKNENKRDFSEDKYKQNNFSNNPSNSSNFNSQNTPNKNNYPQNSYNQSNFNNNFSNPPENNKNSEKFPITKNPIENFNNPNQSTGNPNNLTRYPTNSTSTQNFTSNTNNNYNHSLNSANRNNIFYNNPTITNNPPINKTGNHTGNFNNVNYPNNNSFNSNNNFPNNPRQKEDNQIPPINNNYMNYTNTNNNPGFINKYQNPNNNYGKSNSFIYPNNFNKNFYNNIPNTTNNTNHIHNFDFTDKNQANFFDSALQENIITEEIEVNKLNLKYRVITNFSSLINDYLKETSDFNYYSKLKAKLNPCEITNLLDEKLPGNENIESIININKEINEKDLISNFLNEEIKNFEKNSEKKIEISQENLSEENFLSNFLKLEKFEKYFHVKTGVEYLQFHQEQNIHKINTTNNLNSESISIVESDENKLQPSFLLSYFIANTKNRKLEKFIKENFSHEILENEKNNFLDFILESEKNEGDKEKIKLEITSINNDMIKFNYYQMPVVHFNFEVPKEVKEIENSIKKIKSEIYSYENIPMKIFVDRLEIKRKINKSIDKLNYMKEFVSKIKGGKEENIIMSK